MRIITSSPDDRILDRSLCPCEVEGWQDDRMAHDRGRWRMGRPHKHDVEEELRSHRPRSDHVVGNHLLVEVGHGHHEEEVMNEMGMVQVHDGRSSRGVAGCDVCSHRDEGCNPWEVHDDRGNDRLAEDRRRDDEDAENEIGNDRVKVLAAGLWGLRTEGLKYM